MRIKYPVFIVSHLRKRYLSRKRASVKNFPAPAERRSTAPANPYKGGMMKKKLTRVMNTVYNTEGEKYSMWHMAGFCAVIALGILNLIYYFGA
jgi:hypothetical protein